MQCVQPVQKCPTKQGMQKYITNLRLVNPTKQGVQKIWGDANLLARHKMQTCTAAQLNPAASNQENDYDRLWLEYSPKSSNTCIISAVMHPTPLWGLNPFYITCCWGLCLEIKFQSSVPETPELSLSLSSMKMQKACKPNLPIFSALPSNFSNCDAN